MKRPSYKKFRFYVCVFYPVLMMMGAFMLSGCVQNPKPLGKPMPDLRYDHLQPYKVDGGGVTIQRSFSLMSDSPNDNEIDERLKNTLMQYASSRFDTQAYPVAMVFDVSAVEVIKKSDKKQAMMGLLKTEEELYHARIKVSLNFHKTMRATPIELNKTLFLSDRLSLAEREVEIFEFVEGVILQLDQGIRQVMQNR